MDVGAALVAHPQPAELVQPTQGPLDHPAMHSQPAAVFRAPSTQISISSRGSNWITPWRLAPVRMADRGVPLASVST